MATIHRILGHIHRCQWIQESDLEVVKLRRKVPDQRSAATYAGLGRRPDGFPLPHFAQDICNAPSSPLFGKLPYNARSVEVAAQTTQKSCYRKFGLRIAQWALMSPKPERVPLLLNPSPDLCHPFRAGLRKRC
jgi:hypothetical protein